jgi:hypothetical protein
VYLVADDFGSAGSAWRETDMGSADLETVIQDLLAGEYRHPIRVIAFNTSERWSEDVSEDVAREIQHRCNLQLTDVPSHLQEFVDRSLPSTPCSTVCAGLDRGVSMKETGSARRQSALPRLHRAGPGIVDRPRAIPRALDS